jgi:hypothetical protein
MPNSRDPFLLDTASHETALARLVYLVGLAEAACAGKVVGDPRPAPALPPGLRLVGLITGDDHGLVTASEIYFGYVCTDGVRFYVVLRGTEHFLEWIEDAEFGFVAHPYGGSVEVGFWSVYNSLRYEGQPLIEGLRTAIPSGFVDRTGGWGPVTVIGHSLGGPLAIYAAFDLVKAGATRIACRPFACPKPGDADFAQVFDEAVPDHLVTNYTLDLVPHLPLDEDFEPMAYVQEIMPSSASARVRFSLACNHASLSYAALLDYGYADWSATANAACVKGPREVTT